jgi:ATP-dependent DNA ligase
MRHDTLLFVLVPLYLVVVGALVVAQMLSKLLIRSKGGIQYVEHADGHGERMFEAACRLGLEGIVSKRSSAAYRSG